MNEPLTMTSLLIVLGFAGTLWAIFSVYAKLRTDARDNRILLNVVCRHLGIDPDKILSTSGD